MLDDLQLSIEGLGPAALIGAGTMFLSFCLYAFVALVATLSRGERSNNAYRVLKVLRRHRRREHDPEVP